jgi:RimJ/RimL family protein N-acetyltransferase
MASTADHDHPITRAAAGSARARPAPDGASVAPPPVPLDHGRWSFDLLTDAPDDIALVASWMREPHVAERWGQAWPDAVWSDEVRAQSAGPHSRPLLARAHGDPVAYVEVYRPHLDVLSTADGFVTQPTDLGVHLAIGPRARTGHGLGADLLDAVARGCFAADPACTRVIGDPADDHPGARRSFERAGYHHAAEVRLPHKVAMVHVRRRR